MFINYLKIAWRNLKKNKLFSFINVFGLAVGLTCCLLISLYIYHETSYDAHQKNADRLYQLGTISIQDGKESRYSTTPSPMVPVMQQEFPEVESTVRLLKLFQDDKTLFQFKEGSEVKSFYETKGYLADSTFFRLFSYDFKEGNPATALDQPNTLVISDEIAKNIFGNESALNKTIHINSTTNGAFDFKVTGVFTPSKSPSHIDARFIMSMQSGEVGPWVREMTNMVNNNMFYSYLLLKPGADPKQLQVKFEAFIEKHAGTDLKAAGRGRKQFLTPVKEIHLHANTDGNVTPGGSVKYLYILFSIAIITLLIACVNFMNLSTARSSKRAMEIGVRKVLGAEKKSLVRLFLTEAMLLSLIAFIISVLFAVVLMPMFEQVSGKDFNYSLDQYTLLIGGFLLITLLAGLIAGMYPAFYLSAFQPIKVLKGKYSNSLSAISLRKVLVVFQFVISVALIVASVTITSQMRYLRTKDLGFQKDQQIVIPLRTSTAKSIYPTFKNQLIANPAISSAGASIYYPGIQNVTDWLLYKQGTAPDQTRTMFMNFVDDSYLETLGVRQIAGRIFSKNFPADTANRLVINEQAVKSFGFASAEDAIGKNIAATRNGQEVLFPIVGVVKDFHFKGIQSEIDAYGFLLSSSQQFTYLIAHLKSDNIKNTLRSLEAAWLKLNPNEPFEYSFLDEDFQKNYLAEERLASIIRYFTIIAIFISCLGLFGLATFSAEQRTKEIGIRKVLGANVAGIVALLSKEFLVLVGIAVIIASPIAWYAMNTWLQDFAYRISISWQVFAVTILLVVFIAFVTISFQAIKAAISNPVKSLRTE
jgi:putative ABC transport system permease protein